MTSPYYQTQGGGYDQDALARMYEQTGQFNQQEADRKYKLGKDEIQARMKIAGMQSGDTRYGIEQTRDAARETLEQARQQMIQIGIPQMLINKYVAEKTYEIAASEMQLKRDTLTQDTAQKQAQLQLDREQMERVGIPKMQIDRYVAESNAEVARGRLGLDTRTAEQQFGLQQAGVTGYYGGQGTLEQRKFLADQAAAARTAAEQSRQFNVGASGYMQQAPTLTAGQQSRYQQIQARDEQIRASGGPGVDPSERTELAGYEDILAGRVANPQQPGAGGPGGGGQATLDREKFMQDQLEQARRYGLDVSKFDAELASTPDTYFQARRFQGVDVPRLLGGAGAATTDVAGGPTPGVATMGAYLSGQDPYGQQTQSAGPTGTGGASTGVVGPTAPAAPAGPTAQPLSAQEQARYQQLVARAQQLTAAGEPIPAVDADEQRRFEARGAGGAAGAGAPAAAPLSGQEQARWQQLMERDQQIKASGGPGLEGADLDEAQRFQARGATYTPPTPGGGSLPGYGAGGGGGIAPHGAYGDPYGGGGGGMPGDGGGAAMTGWYDPSGQYGAGGGGSVTPESGWYGSGGGGGGVSEMPAFAGAGDGGNVRSTTSSYGATPYGGSSVNASSGYASAMPSWYTQQYGAGGGAQYQQQQDPAKRVAALAKIMPPSPYAGLNSQDSAALHAMSTIYEQGGQSIAGGEYERLKSSGRLGFLQSAGRMLGRDPKELESQYLSYRPQQANSRLAG